MPDYVKNGVRYTDEKLVNTPLDYENLKKALNVDAAFITEPVNVIGDKNISKGRKIVNKGINEGAKQIMPVLAGAAAAPFALGITAPILNTGLNILMHPVTGRILDTVGTIDGLKNFFSSNGVVKTVEKLSEEDYKGAGLSALGDLFDLYGSNNTLSAILNRNLHAYKSIRPASYKNKLQQAGNFAKSFFSNVKPDINTTYWKNDPLFAEAAKRANIPTELVRKNRESAFRTYTQIPEDPNRQIYIKNQDGSLAYNIKLLTAEHPLFRNTPKQEGLNFDYLTTNGGNVSERYLGNLDGKDYYLMEDIWDVQPFSRLEDKINFNKVSRILTNFVTQNTEKLKNLFIGKKTLNTMRFNPYEYFDPEDPFNTTMFEQWQKEFNSIPKWKDKLDKKLTSINYNLNKKIDKLTDKVGKFNYLEVSPIIGAKPFTMRTVVAVDPKTQQVLPENINLKDLQERLDKTTVRLYRGNLKNAQFNPDRAANGEKQRQFAGMWFSIDPYKISWYLNNYTKGKQGIKDGLEIQYVDIPASQLAKYRASNNPIIKEYPDDWNFEPEDYLIPGEIKRMSIPVQYNKNFFDFSKEVKSIIDKLPKN